MDPPNIRSLQEEAVDTKLALKRKIAQAASVDTNLQFRNLPEKLRIEPEDSKYVVCLFSLPHLIFYR